jgi:hypothetical protein
MPRRHVVRDLEDEEFEFVIQRILAGDTDRELSAAFQQAFDKRLAKSSLNRWRETTGNELAERYRLARFQAKQLLENIQEEGADKFQVTMRTIEDHLLTATREVVTADPIKLLRISQQEQKRKLQEKTLELKRDQLDLERERLRGVKVDKVSLFNEFIEDLLEYIGADKEGLSWINKHLKKFAEFIQKKYAPSEN